MIGLKMIFMAEVQIIAEPFLIHPMQVVRDGHIPQMSFEFHL